MGLAGALLDLLVAPTCASCSAVTREPFCQACAAGLGALGLVDFGSAVLAPGVTAVGAYAYDGVVRTAMHAVKIAGQHAAAPGLGRLMRFELGLPEPADAPWPVTWVPSTRRKLRQRGADIPRLLAGRGAVSLLRRVRGGADQTELSAAERRQAPLGAFSAPAPVPRRVVLVDDVRTTGSTARAAAKALQDAGAHEVLVVTLAVAS